ncbi:hypothetical protein PPERSA_02780 [Pseudocohnilembus persalinus]|uniref:PAS domain n=1 Tax=Pseudocohnilembus persalinus TaxID=266149 RepID=A0A0V0Q8P6_PSEPJ|nr:hypothetical protein PPERSA_02780 [Pseudocohnilembus persalinus]|eukprot:KRW98632.1 hypothetical protein PPERSA_02780 [Pseudocohnilembus persalinus]
MNEFYRQTLEIVRIIKKIEKEIEKQVQQSPNIIQYIKMLSIIKSKLLNDPISSSLHEQMIQDMQRKDKAENKETVNTIEILQGNVGNIIASFRKVNDQGVILSFSARTPELFGYDYNTFKSLYSIKQLLPAYICEIHDLFIERLVTTGEQKVMRNYRSAMAIDKQNYLFDIKLYINYNFQISSEFAFSALCLKQKIKQNKIVIDQQGYITGITEVFAEFTKCKHLDATIFNGLHICLFFPDLKSILMNQVQDLDEDLYFHKTQISFPRSQFIEEYFNNFKMQHRTWKQKSLNNKKILKQQIQLERILQNVLNYQMASQENIMNFSSQHRIQKQSSNINPTPKYDAIVNIVSDKINLINGKTSKIFMISIESYQYISLNSSLKNSSQDMTNTQNAMSIQTNQQYYKQSDTQLAQINEEEMDKQHSQGKSEQEEIEFPTKQEFNKKLNLYEIQLQTLNEYKKQSQNKIKTETEIIAPQQQQDQQSQQENQQEFQQQNQSLIQQQNQQKDFKKLLEGEKSFLNIQKTNSIVKKYSQKQNDLYKKGQSYYINEKSLTSDSELKPGFTANLENISTNFQPNQNANLDMNDSSNIQFLYKESNIQYELDNNYNYYGNFNPQRSSISNENQDFNNKNQDDLSDHSNIQQEEIDDLEQLTQEQKLKLKKLQKKSNGSYNAEEIQGEEQASVSSSLNLRELGNLKNILNFIKNSQWPKQIKIIYASFLFQFLVFLSIFIYLYLKFNASFEDLHTCITKSSLEFLIMVPISLSNLLTSTYLLLENNFIQPTNDPYYLKKYDKNYIQNYILAESSHNYNRFVSNINNITLVEQKYDFEKQMQKLVIDQIKTKDYTILNQFSLPFTELLPMFSEQMHQFTQKNQIQNLDFLSDSIYLYNNNLLTIQDNLITIQKEIDQNLKQILNDINKFNLQFFIIYVFLISVSYLLIFPGMRKIQQKLEKICLCISRMTETEAIQDIEMLNVLNYLLESKNEAYLRHNYNDPSQNNFMSKKLSQQMISSKISKTNKKYKSSGHLNDRIQNPKMNFNFFFFVLVFIFVIAFTLELVIYLFVKSRANTIDTTLQNKLNFVQSSSYLAQSVSFHRIQLIQNILTSNTNLGDDYYINFQQKYYVNLDQYEEISQQKSKQINQAYQGFQEFSRVYLQDGHTQNFKDYLQNLNEGPICSNSEFLDDYQFELCANIYDGQIDRGFSVQISTLINQIKNQDFDSYSEEQLKNYLESQTIINDSLYHIFLMNILRKTIIKFEEEYKQIFDYYCIIQAIIYLVGGFFYIIILGFVMVHYISKIAKDYQDLKKSLQLIPFKRLSEDQTTFQLLKRIFDL